MSWAQRGRGPTQEVGEGSTQILLLPGPRLPGRKDMEKETSGGRSEAARGLEQTDRPAGPAHLEGTAGSPGPQRQ